MANRDLPWQYIIWREINRCNDPVYAEQLYHAVNRSYFSKLGQVLNSWQPRPLVIEVEKALQQICQVYWSGRHVWAKRLRRLDRAKNGDKAIDQLITELESYHWFKRFIARHILFYRGGDAVEALTSDPTDDDNHQIRAWLLRSISAETTERLGSQPAHWVCPDCFVQCQRYRLSWTSIMVYYGCRRCKRSREMLYNPGKTVAVLDEVWRESYAQEADDLRVNWILHRSVFDFDEVRINRASEEAIERFAMQVGNDTDDTRKSRYQHMRCLISRDGHLPQSTIRILENTFSSVEPLFSN